MHEVSLIESVIALVEQERTRQAFVRVNTIRLQVGALGCADPGALRFCFDAVANGTIAEGGRSRSLLARAGAPIAATRWRSMIASAPVPSAPERASE
jgi:Zn finger protein HypA/HybF involved in hydrogenase expression